MQQKKIVIVGSASLQDRVEHWKSFWQKRGNEVIALPNALAPETLMGAYPQVHIDFYRNLEAANRVFVMNEDKNGVVGYLGSESFAELAYVVAQNLIHGKRIEVMLFKMPEQRVPCFDEVELWLNLGWIKLFDENESATQEARMAR